MSQTQGKVFLVGAGPGDPGLLTLRAAELLQTADVVVHDNLISSMVLALIPESAERIYVGKHEGSHTMSQDKINDLLVELSRKHGRVLRLKGGNPFVFGRGGEEAEALSLHRVPFEVVPGVSSGLAVPTYAGIPLTHRDHASSLGLVTGHQAPESCYDSTDWSKVASLDTLVIYMGLRRIAAITEQLIRQGKSPDTPVAVISAGTLPEQAELYGRLDDIAGKVQASGIKAPCIIVVGSVVALHEKLAWFEPQAGKQHNDVVLLAHGSSAAGASVDIIRMASRLTSCSRSSRFHCAFLEREEPSLETAVEQLCQQGADDVVVTPIFLSSGGHVQRDIPTRVNALQQRFSSVRIRLTENVGCGPWMDGAVLSRVRNTDRPTL